jgi:hypothetical protein
LQGKLCVSYRLTRFSSAHRALGLRKGAAALAFLAALAGCSQDHPHSTPVAQSAPAPEPTAPPKLVVAISIDQFSADLFAQYRQHFTGGFARLTQGAVFPSAFQSHAATETCPGHSTLLTGAHPSRTGIIANNWFDLTPSAPTSASIAPRMRKTRNPRWRTRWFRRCICACPPWASG